MTPDEAYETLVKGMDELRPLCRGDNRFTDDDTNPDHVRELCVMCPLLGLCKNYAMTAKPKAGIWAGQRWSTPTQRTGTREDEKP